jgi:hypothetical protein
MTKLIILSFLFIFLRAFSFEYVKLNEIKKGMLGKAYTVFNGNKIETFSVEVLAVVDDENSASKMVLAKVSGDPLEKHGGISEGMSGSPVFVNSRLLGAVAYSANDINSNIALIKPIDGYELNPENPDFNIGDIRPGMAVSISPVRGDIYLENLGTLSMVYGEKVLVYGHPLSNKGDIYYFLNKANIDYTVSTKNSFKIGSSTETVGLVERDDINGLLGILSDKIDTYKFEVRLDSGKKINFEMPKNKNTFRTYLNAALQKSILRNYTTDDCQTAVFNCTIYNEGNEKILEFENFFLDDTNALEILVGNLSDEILSLVDNRFNFLDFGKIEIGIDTYRDKKLIYVSDAFLDKSVYRPGNEVSLKINYLQHQKGFASKQFKFSLPKKLQVGELYLDLVKEEEKSEVFKNFNEFKDSFKEQVKADEILVLLKNSDGDILARVKIPMGNYVQFDKNISKKIIIDTDKAP